MTENTSNIKISWNFDNSYARLPKSFFTNINPTPVSSPEIIILNSSLASNLGLNAQAFGIPTTRSLAVISTGESILRDTQQLGAVLTRVASSHIRVGTFEYVANWGTDKELQALADYTLQRHFPDIEDTPNRYINLLHEVIKRQASLIAQWQLVGFIHGVMNTDNITISGETIDYGPCAFMDIYDPATVFSSIDSRGRYAYGNQPNIAAWNLARFAETLLPLLHDNQEQAIQLAQDEITGFTKLYQCNWLAGTRGKLGIFNEEDLDELLVESLLNMMKKYKADFTNTFCALTLNKMEDTVLFDTEEFSQWNELWQARLSRQHENLASSQQLMRNSNPAIIPRNHRVEEALQAAVNQQDYSLMYQLLEVLSTPYAYSDEQVEY